MSSELLSLSPYFSAALCLASYTRAALGLASRLREMNPSTEPDKLSIASLATQQRLTAASLAQYVS